MRWVVGLFAFYLIIAGSAVAGNREDCRELGDLRARITACTALIVEGGQRSYDLANIFSERGQAYWALGDSERALADYNTAIAINPGVMHHVNRGNALRALGQFDRAIADYEAADAMEPGFIPAWVALARTLFVMGNTDEALSRITEVIGHAENAELREHFAAYFAESYAIRGLIYESLGRTTDAITDFRASLGLDPTQTFSQEGLTRLAEAKELSPVKGEGISATYSFTEDWEYPINSVNWLAWGSPPARRILNGRFGGYAFDSDGDGMCESGLTHSESFSIAEGAKIEFWANFNANQGRLTSWEDNMWLLSIVGDAHQQSPCADNPQHLIGVRYGTLDSFEREFAVSGLSGRVEQLRIADGDWIKVRLVIEPDGHVRLSVDDREIFHSENALDLSNYDQVRLAVGGRSKGRGGDHDHLIDEIKLTATPAGGAMPATPSGGGAGEAAVPEAPMSARFAVFEGHEDAPNRLIFVHNAEYLGFDYHVIDEARIYALIENGHLRVEHYFMLTNNQSSLYGNLALICGGAEAFRSVRASLNSQAGRDALDGMKDFVRVADFESFLTEAYQRAGLDSGLVESCVFNRDHATDYMNEYVEKASLSPEGQWPYFILNGTGVKNDDIAEAFDAAIRGTSPPVGLRDAEGFEPLASLPPNLKGVWSSTPALCGEYFERVKKPEYLDLAFPYTAPINEPNANLYLITAGRIRLYDEADTQCIFNKITGNADRTRIEVSCYNIVNPSETYEKTLEIVPNASGATFAWNNTWDEPRTERLGLCLPLSDLSVLFSSVWEFDQVECLATAHLRWFDLVFYHGGGGTEC